MKRLMILTLALAACSTTPDRPEPIIRTVEVQVPVDDPACVRQALEELGPPPVYPDTPAALVTAPNIYERTRLLLAGRELRMAREAALANALRACSGEGE